ncbi:hypothetical protein [Amycolatopsis sp. CA-128772]|nr:hypothetical protein [Amycolatopsis sp. CA-128772]
MRSNENTSLPDVGSSYGRSAPALRKVQRTAHHFVTIRLSSRRWAPRPV